MHAFFCQLFIVKLILVLNMKKVIKKSELKRLVESAISESCFHNGPQTTEEVESVINGMRTHS